MIKQFTAALCLISVLAACSGNGQKTNSDSLLVKPDKKAVVDSVNNARALQQNEADKAAIAANPDAPAMEFENTVHDFGKIKAGDKVTYVFKFVNSGRSPLIISDATASCGCTKPEFDAAPIKPGGNGAIKVTFDSTNKSGMQDKMITVTANTIPAQTMVHLTGEVVTQNTK